MSFAFFGTALAGYYCLHSMLADERVKAILQQWVGPAYYRLLYNGIALLLLLPLFWWYRQLPVRSWWTTSAVSELPAWFFMIAGASVLFLALRQYDMQTFSGWKQWRRSSGETQQEALQTEGINGLVRHPLYFGSLLLLWGFFLQQAHLAAFLVSLISTLYLVIGTFLEEQKLLEQYGSAYREYRRRVPMLWPGWSSLSAAWKHIKF